MIKFPLIVLKGVVEHKNAGAYFGSLQSLNYWIGITTNLGWVQVSGTEVVPTNKGKELYLSLNLNGLPHEGRGYMWEWGNRITSMVP